MVKQRLCNPLIGVRFPYEAQGQVKTLNARKNTHLPVGVESTQGQPRLVELADTALSKGATRKGVRVRVSRWGQNFRLETRSSLGLTAFQVDFAELI